MRHAFIMYYIKRVFVDLFNDESNSAFAPDVVFIAYVNFGIDLKSTKLFIVLDFLPFFLSLLPFKFDSFILATIHKLSDDVVNFEAVDWGFISDADTFEAIEITHEASLNKKNIISKFDALKLTIL